ncbi:MAG: hypothetical protein ACLTYF_29715 [Escherichia sp.]
MAIGWPVLISGLLLAPQRVVTFVIGPASANPSPVNSSDGGLSVSLCPFRHPAHQPAHSPNPKALTKKPEIAGLF